MATDGVRSEDDLGQKWDRCLADTSMKLVSGAAIGVVFSFLFFKRRPWPVTLFAGIGLGMGYSNCQHDFQTPYILHGKLIKFEMGYSYQHRLGSGYYVPALNGHRDTDS